MQVIKNTAVFKSVERNSSKIIIVDLITGETEEILFKFGDFRRNDISIEDFQVVDNKILVFVNAKTNKKTEDLYTAELNLEGIQQAFYSVTSDIPEKLITVSANKIKEKYILTGTFSKTRSDKSQGIFLAEVENKKLNLIKFYNLLDLKNFTDYLPEKQQNKIERRKANSEEKGKELLLDYNITIHPITLTTDRNYSFLGEAFYPVYQTIFSGPQGQYARRVFVGNQYTHAVIAKFKQDGALIWNNTFAMSPAYWPLTEMKFITTNQDNKKVGLAYSEGNKINYKSFNSLDGNILTDSSKEAIDTKLENDLVRRSFSNVEHWYKNYYVAYGNQLISNKEVKRKIIFINKISLDK